MSEDFDIFCVNDFWFSVVTGDDYILLVSSARVKTCLFKFGLHMGDLVKIIKYLVKNIGIRKSEFVTKTHFLCWVDMIEHL